MPPFPDCANARFVVCCTARAAAVVLSRPQNAILRRGRYKQGSCRRQERTCCEMSIARIQAEPVLLRAQPNFALRFLAAPADVPW